MDKKQQELVFKVGLALVVILISVVLITKRFVYFRPNSTMFAVDESYKVIKQSHLHGLLSEQSKSDKIVLICNSNQGNMTYSAEIMKNMHSLGYRVCTFDYSGFGKSWGIPSEQQLYDDASYMVALLRQTYQPEQIIIYGYGLGATIATYVARRYSIPTLILVSPFPSIASILTNPLKYAQVFFQDFKIMDYLPGYKGRSLLIHSQNDEIIPYDKIMHLIQYATAHISTTGSHQRTEVPWENVSRFIEEK